MCRSASQGGRRCPSSRARAARRTNTETTNPAVSAGNPEPAPAPGSADPGRPGDTPESRSVVNIADSYPVGVQIGQLFGSVHGDPGSARVRIGQVVGEDPDREAVREIVAQARAAAAAAVAAAQAAQTAGSDHPDTVNVQAGNARVGMVADIVTGPVVIEMRSRR